MNATPAGPPTPRHAHLRRRRSQAAAAGAAVLAVAALAAGCGGSPSPGGGSSSGMLARFVAYARCMRDHGIRDFPDPTTSPGGGVSFQLDGGPGTDLGRSNPAFRRATAACRSLEPGGSQPPQQSAAKIAIEVKWAQCMRAHGLPSFPDPDKQGAFDSSKFDENSPAFQTASSACKSLDAQMGPTPVVPGRG
jgi:hypothetical protein